MNIHSDESDLDNEIEEQIKKKLLSHSSPLEKLSRLESLEVGIKLYKYNPANGVSPFYPPTEFYRKSYQCTNMPS